MIYLTNHVGLVQDNPDLVIMTSESLNTPPELVTDVQLVGVKQQQYSVNPLRKPDSYILIIVSLNINSDHSRTPMKSYPRSVLCFSPDKIPGVSTIEMPFNTVELVFEH